MPAILVYGVLLTPGEVDWVPWGHSWSWDIKKWAAEVLQLSGDDLPRCILFPQFNEGEDQGVAAIVLSGHWPCYVLPDAEAHRTVKMGRVKMDPVIQRIFTECMGLEKVHHATWHLLKFAHDPFSDAPF